MPEETVASNETDQELVRRSIEQPDAFGALIERYWNRLFRYIRRTSFATNEDIEDILQETFIKTYKNLNAYDDRLSFSAWIYRICRNTTIDATRRKSSRPTTVELDAEDIAHIIHDSHHPIRILENRDTLKRMSALIKTLPPLYRDVLILRFLEEKSYEEIMDIVQKPKGTVASLVNRGRKLLLKNATEQHIID